MKHLLIIILCIAFLCMIPFVLPQRQAVAESAPESASAPTTASKPSPIRAASENPFDSNLTLHVLLDGAVTEMSLKDYLVGVLLAEMPANFPLEALKAQAVAARTFALRKAEAGKHPSADVCTDSTCCQGWSDDCSEAERQRMEKAVDDTDGLVLTYDDALIDATFFSCSDGKTESAAAVWGSDIPYLQSVDSPGEESAPPFSQTVTIDADEFAETLEDAYPQINLSGTPIGWFGAETRTAGGGIDTVFIGGTAVSGVSLRTLFSLRSTDIAFEPSDTEIQITTYGFGHRVGMSQYGAKAMAENGDAFQDILTHYYQATVIKKLLCPADRAVLFSELESSIKQGHDQGQQHEAGCDPLGNACQLAIKRSGLVLAEVVAGVAGQSTQAAFLAGLEHNNDCQNNTSKNLHDQKDDSQSAGAFGFFCFRRNIFCNHVYRSGLFCSCRNGFNFFNGFFCDSSCFFCNSSSFVSRGNGCNKHTANHAGNQQKCNQSLHIFLQ